MKFNEVILTLFLITSISLSAGQYTILTGFFILVMILIEGGDAAISKRLIYLLNPLLLIIVVGMGVSLMNGYNTGLWNTFKDGWYFSKPIFIFSSTYLVARGIDNFKAVERLILIGGTFSALFHFYEIITVPGFWSMTLFDLRGRIRSSGFLECLSFTLLLVKIVGSLFRKRVPRLLYFSLFLISLLSIYLYSSRSMYAVLLLIIFSLVGRF